jgi:ribosome-associated protein
MGDTLQTSALELGKLLDDHQGLKVVVMDMRPLNFWTDFFIIATATSNTHLLGLERHIKDYTREKGLEILHRSKRPDKKMEPAFAELYSEEWSLLDLGGIVIHIMTAKIRDFFELERLWNAAPIIYGAAGFRESITHSSKSSYSTSSS